MPMRRRRRISLATLRINDQSKPFLHDAEGTIWALPCCFCLRAAASVAFFIDVPPSKLSLEADKSLPPLRLKGPINVTKTLKATASKKTLDVMDGLNTRISELEALLKGAHDSYKALWTEASTKLGQGHTDAKGMHKKFVKATEHSNNLELKNIGLKNQMSSLARNLTFMFKSIQGNWQSTWRTRSLSARGW
jgi:hypothetical protein